MTPGPGPTPRETSRLPSPQSVLIGLAVVLVAIYAALAAISFRFGPETVPVERPVLLVLGLLGGAFGAYLLSIHFALKIRDRRRVATIVLLGGLLMRAVSLFAWPILEIDIYRYIWDGAVALERVSPYQYSPKQVLGNSTDANLPADMRRLVDLKEDNASLGTVLSRIHYAELPTIYPPVSQAVFVAAVFVTPSDASVFTHLVVMKSILLLFDLASLVVVLGLLKLANRHAGWAVAYGWCPLVIKEIANSGHLDSIAVFLAILASYLALKPLVEAAQSRAGRVLPGLSSIVLALAVGAKLFPIVLAPALAWIWIRTHGWRWAVVYSVLCIATSVVVLWPMVPGVETVRSADAAQEPADGSLPPLPTDTADIAPQDPSGGLKAFLGRWEINDLLFMLVVENLRPSAHVEPGQRPWFSIVPEPWKTWLVSIPADGFGLEQAPAAFALSRILTGVALVLIALWLVWSESSSGDPAVWARVAFLTLAWFWLLSPTQNPWYWVWALPLLPFARSHVWLALSGLTLVYYVRFWLIYHWPQEPLLGTPYAGAAFFDYVVVWFEFGPWYLWLALETFLRRSHRQL